MAHERHQHPEGRNKGKLFTQNNMAPNKPAATEPVLAPEGLTEIIETPYEIGQDKFNYRRRFVFELDIHNAVFSVSALGILAFTILTLIFQNALTPFFVNLRDGLTSNLDWFFLSAGNISVLLCIALVVLPWGRIHLGWPEATPDYSYISWFSMLFAAGMGIGLMFSFIGIILVIVFFVTSSDSGSMVIDTICAGGKVNAPTPQRVFWATFEGLVAIALLLGGGLAALQALPVSSGFPFTIVLLRARVMLHGSAQRAALT